MKPVITIIIILLSFNIYSQDFNSAPFTTSQDWMINNLNQTDIKNEVPDEYKLVSEDEKMLVFEKSISSKIYDIKVLYDKGNISSVVFNQHSDKVWNLISEIDELQYEIMENGFKRGAIESESYNSETKPFILVWVTDDNKRTVTGFVNRK